MGGGQVSGKHSASSILFFPRLGKSVFLQHHWVKVTMLLFISFNCAGSFSRAEEVCLYSPFLPDTAANIFIQCIQLNVPNTFNVHIQNTQQRKSPGPGVRMVGLEFVDWKEGGRGASGTHSKDKLLVNVLLGYVWLEIRRLKET